MTHLIINDDVINALKDIDDNTIDCIITDPPYNIKMAGWDAYDSDEEFGLWIREWGKEAYRVLRPGGTIAAFSAARTYQYLAYNLDQAGFKCRDMIEWVYWSGMPKGKNLKQCHEPIYLGYKEDRGNGLGSFTFNIDACRIPVKQKKDKVKINNLEFKVESVSILKD